MPFAFSRRILPKERADLDACRSQKPVGDDDWNAAQGIGRLGPDGSCRADRAAAAASH
jgi:hypothetical protein